MHWLLLVGQLVTNPNFIQFDSPDHYAQGVTSYRIDFTQMGASQPFTGVDVPSGNLTVIDPNIARLKLNLNTPPTQGVLVSIPLGMQCTASIKAVNSVSSSLRSAESNPFERVLLTPTVVTNVVVSKT